MESQHKSGYILITTLLLIMTCSAIIARYVYKLSTIRFTSQSFAYKQQASALAIGSIDLAMDMLSFPKDKKEEAAHRTKLLMLMNNWRTFELTEEIDGIDGQIKILIADEQGKISLNGLYDFKDKKWKTKPIDGKKIVDLVSGRFKDDLKNISLTDQISNYLKDRAKPLYDLSQFAKVKELQKFSERPSFMFDVFSVEEMDTKINPMGLSAGLQKVLGLKISEKIEQKKLAEIISKIPAQVNWQTQWDVSLASFYGKRYNELPQEIAQLFGTSLDGTVYSVIIQVTVKSAFQQLYAVLTKDLQENPVKPFLIKKLVWL
jgi:hypothetical protein